MPVLVQKYGGSSVADLERLERVADKIAQTRRRGYDLVVVVSAMGDTTDELLAMARQISPSPSRRELDMLLSVGERISMTLLSMAIHQRGLEAISLTGSQCGIITTASHSDARIMDVRPFRVQDELARGHIVIVAGYQGTSYKREVTTLGRGGSDTTAVALAAALRAEACEIYSDVDGIYTADPRVVLDAHQLATLTHEEMLEMSRAGARVLNEQAVAFARRAKIALHARSTHLHDSQGTIIRPDGFTQDAERAERGQPVVSVSHILEGLLVEATSSADAVQERLEALEVVINQWAPGESARLFLSLENVPGVEALREELEALGADVRARRCGLVSLIGQGIGGRARWAREALAALARRQIEPLGLDVQLVRLSWVLQSDQVEEAARALHARFLEHGASPEATDQAGAPA